MTIDFIIGDEVEVSDANAVGHLQDNNKLEMRYIEWSEWTFTLVNYTLDTNSYVMYHKPSGRMFTYPVNARGWLKHVKPYKFNRIWNHLNA